MYTGKLVFAQIMDHLPLHTFRRIVARYAEERKVKSFSCLDQFLCMAFAQLTYRESLRDIETCLRAQSSKLYHLGMRSTVTRNTLANANAVRDWRMYADFAQSLIAIARPLYADEAFGVDLKNTVYALDTTTIDLCLSVFPWAPFRSTKAAVKMHTLLDLHGNIPTFIHISDGKMHEVNVLDQLIPEPGAFYIMDRGFTDFARLYRLHTGGSFFVIRGRSNLKVRRRYSHPVERDTGLICDQTVMFTGFYVERSAKGLRKLCSLANPLLSESRRLCCSTMAGSRLTAGGPIQNNSALRASRRRQTSRLRHRASDSGPIDFGSKSPPKHLPVGRST